MIHSSWTRGPDLTKYRYGHACGVVRLGALGTVVLISHGLKKELGQISGSSASIDMEYVPVEDVLSGTGKFQVQQGQHQ